MKKIVKTVPFTKEKYHEMEIKVISLDKQLEEVKARLVVARGMGDLSENGAYKYAKFEIGNIKRQLRRLNGLLERGFIAVTNTLKKDIVEFGSFVSIKNSDGKTKEILIVSKHESNPLEAKIAYSSPMGKVLMRKKVGDIVEVTAPNKISSWTITAIK